MTPQQTNWKVYDGSDEQIAEIRKCNHGYIKRFVSGMESMVMTCDDYPSFMETPTHYWIIPADPLREMKVRQAQTGQPVWVRVPTSFIRYGYHYITYGATTTPDWNIPNAEYSFTEFKD